jgi:SAM-dependent methyltransferase
MIEGHRLSSLEKTVYEGVERPEVEALVPPGVRRILDVGCAAGNLGAALKRRDKAVEVTGIEMSAALAERARVQLDHVLVGTVEERLMDLPDRYFDCVILADVLEHMIDPYRVLAAMRQKLEPGRGMVVASIPNVRHWYVLKELVWHGRWEYAERGLLDSGHLRFFTLPTIAAMFQWAGYRARLADVRIAAPRLLRGLNRLVGGRVQPFIAYQYLVVAHPVPEAGPPDGEWWEHGRSL